MHQKVKQITHKSKTNRISGVSKREMVISFLTKKK